MPTSSSVNPPPRGVDRWALLVGISRYSSELLNLRYAERDALRLRDVLLQPTAGAFAPDHVLTLLDEQATLAGLNRALRTFLKRPAADDLVLLFFACHGSVDPERPENLYLLPHDTDPGDISGTALPMREVDLALRETLHSRRVVVLMDSCHSAGVAASPFGPGSGLRAASAPAEDLNQYLNALSNARGGVSLMTSAMANESSIEGDQWGRGHGVFTHFLLEGLRGKADREPRDGVVTVGELFDYVAEQVKQATGGRQHPHIGGGSDRELPLAVMAASTAEQHWALAADHTSAALWLGEPVCWLGAAAQAEQGLKLRGDDGDAVPVFEAGCALALAGEWPAAEATLQTLSPEQPGVRVLQGLLLLACGQADAARELLLQPQPAAPWAPGLLAPRTSVGRRAALLVGLNRVDPKVFGGWDGQLVSPEKEAQALGELLERDFGFGELHLLLGNKATRSGVLEALTRLVQNSVGLEALVVLLSGHGSEVPDLTGAGSHGRDGTFVAFDGQLLASEIDALLARSRAGRTTIIVSASHSGHVVDRARRHGYDAIAACASNQVDMDGPVYSTFVGELLKRLKPGVTPLRLEHDVRAAVARHNQGQTPQFTLKAAEPVLVAAAGRNAASAAADTAQALLAAPGASDGPALAEALELMAQAGEPALLAANVAIAAAGLPALAARLVALPLPQQAPLPLVCAALQAATASAQPAHQVRALQQLARHPALATAPALAAEAQALASAVQQQPPLPARLRVLLVNAAATGGRSSHVRMANASLKAVKSALLSAGVPAARLRELASAPTPAAVRAAVHELGAVDTASPWLVYWFGEGDLGAMACTSAVVSATDLAAWVGQPLTLLCDGVATAPGGGRRPPVLPGGLHAVLAQGPRAGTRIGEVAAALTAALEAAGGQLAALRFADLESAGPVTLLAPAPAGRPSPQRRRTARNDRRPLGSEGHEQLLPDPLAARLAHLAQQVRAHELGGALARLQAFVDQHGSGDANGLLQLGVMQLAHGQHAAALGALERTVALAAAKPRLQARARVLLARVLLESGRDRARAVSECQQAAALDPALTEALFWLGRAITELIQRETRTQAREALAAYLQRGAPAGRRAQALQLLEQLAAGGN